MKARRIRSLDASERTRALTELASQIGTAERNRRNGYPAPELAFTSASGAGHHPLAVMR